MCLNQTSAPAHADGKERWQHPISQPPLTFSAGMHQVPKFPRGKRRYIPTSSHEIGLPLFRRTALAPLGCHDWGYCRCVQTCWNHLNALEKYLLATKSRGQSQGCCSVLGGGTKHVPGEGTEPPGILLHALRESEIRKRSF